MERERYLKIGELLLRDGLISNAQLEKAIAMQRKEGGRLGEILVKLEMVREDQIVSLLGKQLNIPTVSLANGRLKPVPGQGLEKLLPQEVALKNSVIPLFRTTNTLTVALTDPLDVILIDNLKRMTGCDITPVIAAKSDIVKAIMDFYGKSAMLQEAVEASYVKREEIPERTGHVEEIESELGNESLIARAEEAPVVKLVDLIIRQAIDDRASDIHIEPFKNKISLRYRIDGRLYEVPPPARHLHLPILSRVKILAKLDIAEKRLPQDGAIMVKMDERAIDIRVSTIPTIYGEKVVLRILDRSHIIFSLDQFGFDAKQLEHLRKAMNSPYGLILVTGPTGSGKSTTLYAILSEIKKSSINIVTVEDPVEYKMDGINQVQVKPEIGLTFASALRSFLRQDPDVMLVGEVRDLETAQICIRSALTGHLVVSTLHTNDAPSAVTRLMDIGIEPYMVAPSLLCIVAQRLLRKLCPDCKVAYEPSAKEKAEVGIKAELLYKPKGCAGCSQTGYKGRVVIAEVLPMNESIKELVTQRASFQRIREVARQQGMVTLNESAIKKADLGVSSLEEALSITLGAE